MTLDWYPAIRECCAHWPDAPMLQQTFEALEKSFGEDNDACIDCAKSIVEVICRVIIDELDDPRAPERPEESNPKFARWVSAAVKVLKLGRSADQHVRDLISAHHSLTNALGSLRNDCGPVSHGRPAFTERLSSHHRRAAVLSADAIVALLHQTYQQSSVNLSRTREPYERFRDQNDLIDKWCGYEAVEIDEDGFLAATVALPGEEHSLLIEASPSQFLFQLDRTAYVEALNVARSAEELEPTEEGEAMA